MFQFPGFALKPLCIQGKSTWLTPLFAAQKHRNNRISGGFPHSEIHGSKPIPGSPWLNAGYHVLHRLLLPRHPPNALFALDLIQEEQGWFNLPPWRCTFRCSQSFCKSKLTCQKLHTFPPRPTSKGQPVVSVLDLEQYHLSRLNADVPLLGATR
jgi:hypothetical protein